MSLLGPPKQEKNRPPAWPGPEPMGPWALGPLGPWAHGPLGPWAQGPGPMGPWAHVPMGPGPRAAARGEGYYSVVGTGRGGGGINPK